jgi:hypothetical protein
MPCKAERALINTTSFQRKFQKEQALGVKTQDKRSSTRRKDKNLNRPDPTTFKINP